MSANKSPEILQNKTSSHRCRGVICKCSETLWGLVEIQPSIPDPGAVFPTGGIGGRLGRHSEGGAFFPSISPTNIFTAMPAINRTENKKNIICRRRGSECAPLIRGAWPERSSAQT